MIQSRIQPGTVLYRFSSQDNIHKGYLFGTMHVSDLNAFSYFDLAVDALTDCQLLATEIDLDIGGSYDLNALLELKDGKRLNDFMSEKQYAKLRRIFLKAFKLDVNVFNRYLPLFFLNVITENELMQAGNKSLDQAIWMKAVELNIERTGLENFNVHYDVLRRIPVEYQVKMLVRLSKNISAFRKGMVKLSQHYSEGNLAQLYLMTKKSLGKIKQIMLHERNHIMVESVIELSREKKLFAAMGASHLWGNKGVIAELKRKGFKLTPVYK